MKVVDFGHSPLEEPGDVIRSPFGSADTAAHADFRIESEATFMTHGGGAEVIGSWLVRGGRLAASSQQAERQNV